MLNPESRQYSLKRRLGVLLRPLLSPRLVQLIRYRLWWISSYFPRLVTSRFVKRTAQIRGFCSATTSSSLVKQLEGVNMLSPTKMCRVMTKYGSDKGRLNNYTPIYSALFREHYDRPLLIFELGLGTNNTALPSNMGPYAAPGASLRAWRDLFPRALVYGADIDRNILFREDRIETFFCDQLDPAAVQGLWSNPGLQNGADVIIDDGLHTLQANITFLEESLDRLRPGGVYIIEDILGNDIDELYEQLETTCAKHHPGYDFAFVTLGEGGSNNLLVVRADRG